jgi:CBS domain-containing membrane protein
MKDTISVASIMTKNLVMLKVDDELSHAESLFKKNKIRHIPVVENGEIIGMLSFTDLLRISFVDAVDDDAEDVNAEVYNLFTMRQVMTKNVVTITADTTIKQAATMFLESEFHALPVVENGKITGIVTTTDLLRYFISE